MKFSRKFIANFSYIFFTILVLFFLVCMIANPATFITQSLNGISAWAFNVLPSVLPFMFFTRVLSALDIIPKLVHPLSPVSQKLFKTPPISLYAFVLAILSGYPVGSKMVADLFLQGKITKQDAFKMSAFCSTSGPMFIVGAVGIGMFKSTQLGYILFLSHVIGAILNGVVFRNLKTGQEQKNLSPASVNLDKPSFNLSDIVLGSTLSILSVGTIIVIFFIVIECFSPILSLLPQNVSFFFEGVIEITKGCLDISTISNKILAVCLCSFVIGFGGISTILQSLTMLAQVKMPVKLFVLQKIFHALLSICVTILLLFIFPL